MAIKRGECFKVVIDAREKKKVKQKKKMHREKGRSGNEKKRKRFMLLSRATSDGMQKDHNEIKGVRF